jgi:hypothetical protein
MERDLDLLLSSPTQTQFLIYMARVGMRGMLGNRWGTIDMHGHMGLRMA